MQHKGLIRCVIISSLSLCVNSFAMNTYYCAKTASYASLGDSTDQVAAKCGQPAQMQNEQSSPTTPTAVTQWIYNYQNQAQSRFGHPVYQAAALIVNMINNKITSILVNGQNVQSTNFCSNTMLISVGDDNLRVRQLCGTPTQTQDVVQNIPQPSVDRAIWTYQSEYGPKVTLTFEKGLLTSIEQ